MVLDKLELHSPPPGSEVVDCDPAYNVLHEPPRVQVKLVNRSKDQLILAC